jgi:hypothetical protein
MGRGGDSPTYYTLALTHSLALTQAFMEFRRKENLSLPLSFLPLDMSFDIIAPGPLDLPLTSSNTPGFVGYAINLIMLRDEHEHLRMSVVWALFKDLSVFIDEKSAREAEEKIGRQLFWCSIKEAKLLPDPPIMVASGEMGWYGRTGVGNHAEMEGRARERHGRALRMLNKRVNVERRAGVAEMKKCGGDC